MGRSRARTFGAVAAFALAGAVGVASWRVLPLLSTGAGLKAGHMCSAVFLAGRDPRAVVEHELRNVHPVLDFVPEPRVDYGTRSVTTPLLFGLLPRRAVYREGMGTTLLPRGASLDVRATLPFVETSPPPGDPSQIPWPDGDLVPEAPGLPDVDVAALDAAVGAAFGDARYAPSETIGVVVVYRGRIVAERYAPGFGMHVQYRTWSTAKSLTNALVGVLVGEGKLEVHAPAPIPEWQAPDDPRRSITVDHLLHMSSGLESGGSWTPEAYWGGIDTAATVVRSRLEVEPGTRWKYSNYDTLLLVRAMKEVLGDAETYLSFPRRALLNRIGMRDTVPETDPFGNFILSSQVYTTPRDLARFGLLYLRDGVWHGERLLPEGWVAYTRTPAPATLTLPEADKTYAGYGAQFWLYGRDPRLPADTYSTSGARGQHATIVPSHDLVVARMGLDPLQESGWDQPGFVAEVLVAFTPPRKESDP